MTVFRPSSSKLAARANTISESTNFTAPGNQNKAGAIYFSFFAYVLNLLIQQRRQKYHLVDR
jgi:hypothetical protein